MTSEEALAHARALDTNPAGYSRLLTDFAEIRAAHHAWTNSKNPRDKYTTGPATVELKRVRTAQRNAFARSRGWKVADPFTVAQLKAGRMTGPRWDGVGISGREIDHPDYFTIGRKPAAILSHSYGPWEDSAQFARDEGLNVEQLPYSWYYPLNAHAALFTRIAE